jgi:hypothetical protein
VRYLHKTIVSPAGESMLVEAASHYRADTQVLHFDLFYLRGDELLRTKQVNMRCFFPEELRALCEFNGFAIEERFGDYEGKALESASPKQLLICRRRDT